MRRWSVSFRFLSSTTVAPVVVTPMDTARTLYDAVAEATKCRVRRGRYAWSFSLCIGHRLVCCEPMAEVSPTDAAVTAFCIWNLRAGPDDPWFCTSSIKMSLAFGHEISEFTEDLRPLDQNLNADAHNWRCQNRTPLCLPTLSTPRTYATEVHERLGALLMEMHRNNIQDADTRDSELMEIVLSTDDATPLWMCSITGLVCDYAIELQLVVQWLCEVDRDAPQFDLDRFPPELRVEGHTAPKVAVACNKTYSAAYYTCLPRAATALWEGNPEGQLRSQSEGFFVFNPLLRVCWE